MAADLYAILGLSPAATPAEITHAYRILVRQHHPDSRTPDQASPTPNSGPTHASAAGHDTALQDIVDAYRVLHDPIQRATYDKGRQPQPHPKTQPRRQTTPRVPVPRSDQPPIIAGPVYWEPASRR